MTTPDRSTASNTAEVGIPNYVVLPCFISALHSEPVLRRKGHEGRDRKRYRKDNNRRDLFSFISNLLFLFAVMRSLFLFAAMVLSVVEY
jgi:hypothetical protein